VCDEVTDGRELKSDFQARQRKIMTVFWTVIITASFRCRVELANVTGAASMLLGLHQCPRLIRHKKSSAEKRTAGSRPS